VDSVDFVSDVTKSGNKCVIVQFWQTGQRFPIHREWLLLWHENDYARTESLKKLSAMTGGQYKAFEGLNPDEVAASLGLAYQERVIPRISFLLVLPDKKNPKYNRIVATGNDDE
jgi:hypothetical protein